MHDYFTGALPFAQKGAPVQIPILGDAPVKYYASSGTSTILDGTPDDLLVLRGDDGGADNGTMYADLGEANVTSINDLRRAFSLQRWLELNARAGTRYTENTYANFGVKSPDARLQRPEYITGSRSNVVISEVLNTTGSFDPADPAEPTSRPQGDMAGHGISVTSGRQGSYYCYEHGYIIGIMSVMPVTAYQQGIPKHFLKVVDPFQYYWPAFAHIGEQEIVNQELYLDSVDPNGVFGYTPRYAEYKYMPSRVAGDFRTTLNFWHLGRIFSSKPALNQSFIECNPSKRIFAVESSEHSLWAHVLNKVHAQRSMPKFGNPI